MFWPEAALTERQNYLEGVYLRVGAFLVGSERQETAKNMRTLTANQKAICVLVGQGKTQRDAAAQVDVSEYEVSRWYNDINGLGEAMAHWTGIYADRYASELLGKALATALKGMETSDLEVAVRAAEVVTKRIAQIEKRETDRARLGLDREALAAKIEANKPDVDAPTGKVFFPVEESTP